MSHPKTLREWINKNKSLIIFYLKNHDREVPSEEEDFISVVRNDISLRNTAMQVGVVDFE